MKHLLARLCAALVLIAACSHPADKNPTFGSWVVIDYTLLDVSAMSQDEAGSWLGKVATYAPEKASFGDEICESPRYEPGAIQAEDLSMDYRVSPISLGFSEETIDIVRVYCRDSEWIAPGGVLFLQDATRRLTVWDGVFFLLQKQ